MISAGLLRHRISIEAYSTAKNGRGEDISQWATHAQRWADVTPLSGREAERAKQIEAEATWKITLRYDPTIQPDHRIKFDGRTLDILSIIDTDYQHRELQILAKEHA